MKIKKKYKPMTKHEKLCFIRTYTIEAIIGTAYLYGFFIAMILLAGAF